VNEATARLQMPVVVVTGRESMFSPVEVSDAFKRVNAGIDVRTLEKSSYQLQDERAMEFNSLIGELAGSKVTQ